MLNVKTQVPSGNANVDADLAPLQGDIKESALYIANRKAYETYDEEDKKEYKYTFRTRRRKNEGAADAPAEKAATPAELPLLEAKVNFMQIETLSSLYRVNKNI